jgi:hypothetical protein
MYARIESNEIVEQDAVSHEGVAGWIAISDEDIGKPLVYDTGTSAVRVQTDAEITAEADAYRLANAWNHLRKIRTSKLELTDSYMVPDRAATPNMLEYRTHLRDLPATYDDTSILSQTPVMEFDEYVASL